MNKINFDIFKPKSLNDYSMHLEIVNKLKNLSKYSDINNILLHGSSGSGKYTLIMSLLADILGKDIYNKKINTFTLSDNDKNYSIDVSHSAFHYELDTLNYNNSDLNLISLFINNIASSFHLVNNKKHIFIVKNADLLNFQTQYNIKSSMDKYINTCRIIFLFKNTSSISDYLSSRCLRIRINKPLKSDISKLILKITKTNNIDISLDNLKNIINESEQNLHQLLYLIKVLIIKKKYVKYDNIFENKILEISNIIFKNKDSKYIEIRNLLMDIMLTNYDLTDFFLNLVKYYIKLESISNFQKSQIIEYGALYQHRCQNGYRKLYHMEAFTSKLILILT